MIGDGIVSSKEICDDKNEIENDGCTKGEVDFGFICSGTPSNCISKCGDGLLSSDEECDIGDSEDEGCVECKI